MVEGGGSRDFFAVSFFWGSWLRHFVVALLCAIIPIFTLFPRGIFISFIATSPHTYAAPVVERDLQVVTSTQRKSWSHISGSTLFKELKTQKSGFNPSQYFPCFNPVTNLQIVEREEQDFIAVSTQSFNAAAMAIKRVA